MIDRKNMVQRYEEKMIYARGEMKKVSNLHKIAKIRQRGRDGIPGNRHRTGYQPGQWTKEKSLHKMQAE